MPDDAPANTPAAPYWAVIFTNRRTAGDDEAYAATAERMLELAARQPGYLGVESVRDANGLGITVSYWRSREAIAAWRAQAEHVVAQRAGLQRWYAAFELRVAEVRDARSFARDGEAAESGG
jgi:heme-degrading monooxygenase HmoA